MIRDITLYYVALSISLIEYPYDMTLRFSQKEQAKRESKEKFKILFMI